MKLKFRHLRTPDAIRQFCEGKNPSDYVHEWNDTTSDIPVYGSVCIMEQIKDLLELADNWEDDPETFGSVPDSEFAHLGPGPFFFSFQIVEAGRLKDRKAIASLEGYELVNASCLVHLLKVYGFYEKGKNLPYRIECALKKEYLDTYPYFDDQIRLIDDHAAVSDFVDEKHMTRILSEQFGCDPIPFGEDLGFHRFSTMKTSPELIGVENERPKTIPHSPVDTTVSRSRPMVLSAKSKRILDRYDNEKPFAWFACGVQRFYFHNFIYTPLCIGTEREKIEKEGLRIGKRGVLRRKGGNPHIEIYALTEAAYHVLKSQKKNMNVDDLEFVETQDMGTMCKYKGYYVRMRVKK